jgi:hypothetical protein
MASSFMVTNGNTKVDFNFTAPTTTVQNIVGGAAEYLFNHGRGDRGTEEAPVNFTDLTNTQKLTIVEDYVKQVIIDLANTNKSLKAQEVARTTEEESKYSL